MPDPDLAEPQLARAVDRIARMTLAAGAAGTLVALIGWGWPAAAGFLAGAVASYLNFRWLKRLVNALGKVTEETPPRARVAVFLGLRYALLAAGAYAILVTSIISLPAALAGLFVSAAAVIIEIVFELVYARI